ncbi:MAG TPA: cation-translocating P-type ATPase [Anaerolineae bacterium]|nr:cation-translocating P-type ATPase [Anaerolineae bacterium]HIP72279.1 cation-translocating P-type ATPase [Anaerolineae bacterium]
MKSKQLEIRVGNLDCEHDAAAIERGLQGTSGLETLQVYPKSAKVILTYNPDTTSPDALKEKLDTLGFPAQAGFSMPEQPKPWRNPKVLTSLISGGLLLVGWLLTLLGAPELVSTMLYAAAIPIGGYYFGREGIEGLIYQRRIGIELLMSVAAVVAAVMGQVGEAAMLVFLYSISEAIEGYTEEKTRSAVKALMDLAPKTALVRRNGRIQEIPVEELVVGDIFLVKPGQAVPTDGVVVNGRSSINQAPVTGESVPVEKQPGDALFAGSINASARLSTGGQGALEAEATKIFADNTISRIIQMVEEAQERKGQSQRFIEKFGDRYSPAVLLIGLLIAIVPPLLLGQDWAEWINRATVFIVAAAPCALVISIPITLVATLGTGARQGVLIKGGVYVEKLATVEVVALDKTGTITRGEPQVTDVIGDRLSVIGDRLSATDHRLPDTDYLIALAAGLESRSEHPLARAVVQYAAERGIGPVEMSDFQALSGAGVQAQWQGRTVYIGSPALFREQLGVSLAELASDIERRQGEGKTVVLVGEDTAVYGLIAIQDTIRENARDAIAQLHGLGIKKVVMLTGDNERTAQAIAQEAGVDTWYANLKPEDKVVKVRQLTAQYGNVVMVGDGVNDAPALAEATVGVAMGAAGTDVALETADVALMADDLEKLVYALQLSHRSQNVVRQNIVLAIIVISALSLGAVAGLLTLPMAVLGHEISEFIVIGNGLRMLRA